MIDRAIILLLCLTVLLFEIDLVGGRVSSRSGAKRVVVLAAVPLLVAFLLVVVRRWRQFS
jgi:hypothetical protein